MRIFTLTFQTSEFKWLQICIKHLHCVKTPAAMLELIDLRTGNVLTGWNRASPASFMRGQRSSHVKHVNPPSPSVNDFNIISLFVLQQSYKSAQCCMLHETLNFTFASESYPNFRAHMLLFYCFSLQTLVSFSHSWDLEEKHDMIAVLGNTWRLQ